MRCTRELGARVRGLRSSVMSGKRLFVSTQTSYRRLLWVVSADAGQLRKPTPSPVYRRETIDAIKALFLPHETAIKRACLTGVTTPV